MLQIILIEELLRIINTAMCKLHRVTSNLCVLLTLDCGALELQK